MATNDVPAAQQAEAGDAAIESLRRIIPSEMDEDALFVSNGEYVLLNDVRAAVTALKSSQQQLRPLLPLGHEPIVCYLRASNGEQRWIGCSCGANVETFNMTDRFWYRNHIADLNESLFSKLKSSQQEEIARTSDNVIELAGKAVRACGGEKSKTILVARILDVELEAVHAAHLTEQAKARADKDGAYEERNRLVALLSSMFPSSLERHPDEDLTWSDDWRWVVYIDFPYGQASWHIHDSQLSLFDHLKRFQGRKWDGHSTEQKYASVAAMTILMQENETRYAAEQAKAQEAHQKEPLPLGMDETLDCLKQDIRDALKRAEQTSLASQAKLIRKCADLLPPFFDALVQLEPINQYLWPTFNRLIKETHALVTPEMEAALAAEKALEGHNE